MTKTARALFRKPTRRQRDWCCTYGGDDDVVPGAPRLRRRCSAYPCVWVVPDYGLGRCAKHARGIK